MANNLLQVKVLFAVIFNAKNELFDGVLHVRNKRVGSLESEKITCYDASEQRGCPADFRSRYGTGMPRYVRREETGFH